MGFLDGATGFLISPVPLGAGTKIGPYEIVAPIGAGGMGEVYRARDPRLGRMVALKVISAAALDNEDRIARFEIEAKATSALSHPSIVSIYDVGTHDGVPYIVSELLEGQSLNARLADGPIPWQKAVEYALQVAGGLAAAHAKGVVHRDLKPDNLFLTKDGRVKILDFGLAKLQQSLAFGEGMATATALTATGSIVGTVRYMSPEQVRGEPTDHRSDIFSFGVVLYELLTGRRAFERASRIETMHATLKDALDLPPGPHPWPPALTLLVHHCIEKDPDNRFQSARDLAFDLSGILQQASSSMAQLARAPAVEARRWWRRIALAALIVGAAGAVGIPAFIAGVKRGRSEPPTFHQLTFRRGLVHAARFAPDGETVMYGAAWEGRPLQVFSTRPESPESRHMGLPDGDILAISRSGEMAVSLGRRFVFSAMTRGTLARVPLLGGATREVLDDVEDADWSPDGSKFAAIHVVGGKYRLEYPIGTVLYESAGWMNRVRVSPDGERVAFLDHAVYGSNEGDVCIIGSDRRKRVLSSGWVSVTGLTWHPDNKELWFSASERSAKQLSLYAVNLDGTQRVLLRSTGRLSLQDIHPNGRVLLIESHFRGLITYRTGDDPRERELGWLDASVAADLSEDGKTLLFNEQGAGAAAMAVYARGTDGSPGVHLGEGISPAISHDGRTAAAIAPTPPRQVVLLPTGAGPTRRLDRGPIVDADAVAWMPGDRQLLISGHENGRGNRLYVQDVKGGLPRPVSGEGLRIQRYSRPITPDGTRVAAFDAQDRVVILTLADGRVRLLEGVKPAEVPIRWSADGRYLYVFWRGGLPATVHRVDVATHERQLVAKLSPWDPSGVRNLISVLATPDHRTFVYSYSRTLSDVYIVDNLR